MHATAALAPTTTRHWLPHQRCLTLNFIDFMPLFRVCDDNNHNNNNYHSNNHCKSVDRFARKFVYRFARDSFHPMNIE